MTGRYALKTGYIYLDAETSSKQIDILVIDEHIPFTYLFQEGDFVVVHPEPVIAAIEIKTKLDLSEFRKAFENIVTAKRIKQRSLGYYGHIFGAVFGFFSNKVIDNSSLNKWFKDESIAQHGNDVGALWPDEIFFFDNERTLSLQETTTPDKRGNYFYQLICPSNGTDYKALQLSLLVGILFSICESEELYFCSFCISNVVLNELFFRLNFTLFHEYFPNYPDILFIRYDNWIVRWIGRLQNENLILYKQFFHAKPNVFNKYDSDVSIFNL